MHKYLAEGSNLLEEGGKNKDNAQKGGRFQDVLRGKVVTTGSEECLKKMCNKIKKFHCTRV